jgi:hypothetical protein
MSKVTKTFTFKVPDDYTLQEAANDSSVSFTYHGPHYLKVELKPDNKISSVEDTTLEQWTEENAQNDNTNAVLVNAVAQPLEASIMWAMKDSDIADLPQRVKTGPDGAQYSNPWPLPPHKAYEKWDMVWDQSAMSWSKPWHKPWITWNDINAQAVGVVAKASAWLDADSAGDSDLTAAWTTIRDEAAGKVNAWSSAGFMPHEVVFRLTPEDSDTQAELANRPDPDSA